MRGKKFEVKDIGYLLKESFKQWNDDDAFTYAAATAYYAIFPIPAILLIVINIAGAVFGKAAVEGKIQDSISKAINPDAASQIQETIANVNQSSSSTIMAVIGIATLLVASTGLFVQIQAGLNRMWDVKPDPNAGIIKMLLDRILSFGIILAVGFLLLISLVLTTVISILSDYIMNRLPDFMIYIIYGINFVVTFAIITVLFAMMFKFLPDVQVKYKSVWVGAIVTAFLFILGKFGLGIYMGMSDPGSAYGAAGSIILLILWIYYSCLILFFGAEFTQTYAKKYGHEITPSKHAVKVSSCDRTHEEGFG